MSSVKNFSILEIPHFYLGQLGVAMVIVWFCDEWI